MNDEFHHVMQFQTIQWRATCIGLEITLGAESFVLMGPLPKLPPGTKRHWVENDPEYQREEICKCNTLAELRAAISDYVATSRIKE